MSKQITVEIPDDAYLYMLRDIGYTGATASEFITSLIQADQALLGEPPNTRPRTRPRSGLAPAAGGVERQDLTGV